MVLGRTLLIPTSCRTRGSYTFLRTLQMGANTRNCTFFSPNCVQDTSVHDHKRNPGPAACRRVRPCGPVGRGNDGLTGCHLVHQLPQRVVDVHFSMGRVHPNFCGHRVGVARQFQGVAGFADVQDQHPLRVDGTPCLLYTSPSPRDTG